jgi:hypothetical protein
MAGRRKTSPVGFSQREPRILDHTIIVHTTKPLNPGRSHGVNVSIAEREWPIPCIQSAKPLRQDTIGDNEVSIMKKGRFAAEKY